MPRDLSNWNYKDIVAFLEHHHFKLAYQPGGSHRYFVGLVDGEDRQVEVQYHASKSIKAGTLKLSIIPKSGIPEGFWIEWANIGNRRLQKKLKYKGAGNRWV